MKPHEHQQRNLDDDDDDGEDVKDVKDDDDDDVVAPLLVSGLMSPAPLITTPHTDYPGGDDDDDDDYW